MVLDPRIYFLYFMSYLLLSIASVIYFPCIYSFNLFQWISSWRSLTNMYCIGSPQYGLFLSCLITSYSIHDPFCLYLQFQLISMDKQLEELHKDVLYWILNMLYLFNVLLLSIPSMIYFNCMSVSTVPIDFNGQAFGGA